MDTVTDVTDERMTVNLNGEPDHHHNQARKAMVETLALEAAVEAALELSSREDTLVVVTADHSHAVTINGYADRGNNILGTYMDIEKVNTLMCGPQRSIFE